MKLPAPSPSEVILSETEGLGFLLQHTPLAETISPPSELTLPPLIADDEVIFVKGDVDKSGSPTGFSFYNYW